MEALGVFLSGRHSFETEQPLGHSPIRFRAQQTRVATGSPADSRKDELCCHGHRLRNNLLLLGRQGTRDREVHEKAGCFLKWSNKQPKLQLCPTGVWFITKGASSAFLRVAAIAAEYRDTNLLWKPLFKRMNQLLALRGCCLFPCPILHSNSEHHGII